MSLQYVFNGHAYNTDDYNASTNPYGLGAGGARLIWNTLWTDIMTDVSVGMQMSAADSITIGTGSKTFTPAVLRGLPVGAPAWIIKDASNWMWGQVTAVTSTQITFNVTATNGSGTYTAWTIQPSGPQGPTATINGTANQVGASTVAGVTTLTLPAAIVAPGTLQVGGVAPGGGASASFSTTTIAGLTATLLGALTAGTQDVTGGKYKGASGKINALGSITGSNAVDYTLGNVVTATQNNAAVTFTFNNWPASGTYGSLEVIVTLDATPHTVTFTGVTWDTQIGAPSLIASKKLRVLLETEDGGSTIYASLIGQF